MDPTACLRELLDELTEEAPDRDAVEEKLESLLTWVRKGGALPVVHWCEVGTFQVGD